MFIPVLIRTCGLVAAAHIGRSGTVTGADPAARPQGHVARHCGPLAVADVDRGECNYRAHGHQLGV